MIDHVVVNVTDLTRSRTFYEAALAPLGYRAAASFPDWLGFAAEGKPDLWLARRDPAPAGVHFAFRAARREDVDRFHAEGLRAGGVDHGAPGIRAEYGADYYGAFVLDPDGNNVEAVCFLAG